MGIQNNNKFFFNKGAEQDFSKNLEKNIINEVNKKYKELLTELNYLKNQIYMLACNEIDQRQEIKIIKK